jgi:hypothetical protein
MSKSRRQESEARSQKDKAEARNQNSEEEKRKSVDAVSALSSGS